MESGPQPPPPALIPFFWSPGWNSIQSVNKFQSEIGGPLRGGDPGVRLIEPREQIEWTYFSRIPAAFRPDAGAWLILPRFHIFGSEELSLRAPAIAELIPRPYIGLNATDAALLGVKSGELITLTMGGASYALEICLLSDVPRGVALVPAGIPPVESLSLPARGKLTPVGAAVHEFNESGFNQ
jgi:NADH-quinone oxidoreductase subunit G